MWGKETILRDLCASPCCDIETLTLTSCALDSSSQMRITQPATLGLCRVYLRWCFLYHFRLIILHTWNITINRHPSLILLYFALWCFSDFAFLFIYLHTEGCGSRASRKSVVAVCPVVLVYSMPHFVPGICQTLCQQKKKKNYSLLKAQIMVSGEIFFD